MRDGPPLHGRGASDNLVRSDIGLDDRRHGLRPRSPLARSWPTNKTPTCASRSRGSSGRGWSTTRTSRCRAREIVLPIDHRDVRHHEPRRPFTRSDPAFLMKIDAVPGLTRRVITLKPTKTGTFQSDPQPSRAQATQLCGTSHSRMRIPVRVVSEQDSTTGWQGRLNPRRPPRRLPVHDGHMIIAKNVKFDLTDITVRGGRDHQTDGAQRGQRRPCTTRRCTRAKASPLPARRTDRNHTAR